MAPTNPAFRRTGPDQVPSADNVCLGEQRRPRLTLRRSRTRPFASPPCTENTSFAKSNPTVVTLFMTSRLVVD